MSILSAAELERWLGRPRAETGTPTPWLRAHEYDACRTVVRSSPSVHRHDLDPDLLHGVCRVPPELSGRDEDGFARDFAAGSRKLAQALLDAVESVVNLPQPRAICAVWRAGLAFCDPPRPDWAYWHLGLRKSPAGAPERYHATVPASASETASVLLVDGVLATGASTLHALDQLTGLGVPAKRIGVVAFAITPEAVARVLLHHPEVRVHTALDDTFLAGPGWIIPNDPTLFLPDTGTEFARHGLAPVAVERMTGTGVLTPDAARALLSRGYGG